jgi:hypothetical protein
VLALGSLGVAYAAWTDSVYINGTVYTGTLDINIVGCSSTFVYKTPTDQIDVRSVTGENPPSSVPAENILVAWAITEFINGDNDPDTATMTFGGLFPNVDFQADLELQYFGTIPAKVSIAEIFPANDDVDPTVRDAKDAILAALWQLGETTKTSPIRTGAWVDGELTPFPSTVPEYIDDPLGMQLHQLDTVHVTLHVRLPQDDARFKNLTNLKFTGKVTVIQWNEYE